MQSPKDQLNTGSQGRLASGRGSIIIAKKINSVFSFISDPSKDTLWMPNVEFVEIFPQSSLGLGSKVRQAATFLGNHVESEWEVTDYTPPSRMKGISVSGPINFRRSYTCEDRKGSTLLKKSLEICLEGMGPLMPESLASALLSRAINEALARLKNIIER